MKTIPSIGQKFVLKSDNGWGSKNVSQREDDGVGGIAKGRCKGKTNIFRNGGRRGLFSICGLRALPQTIF